MVLVNSVVCGLEFCASAAFTYIPPMLLKAGLSEENMSFALGVGPCLGFFIVPWIGRSSDTCRSRFGRRRPFILSLSMLLIIALVIIPYGDSITAYMTHNEHSIKRIGVLLLIVGAVLLDFTSQATLTPCEALVADATHNTNQQDRGFMVYSFMVSMGGCIGYLITAVDWSSSVIGLYFGSQERSVFSILVVLFSFTLVLTLFVAQESPLSTRKRLKEPGTGDEELYTSLIIAQDTVRQQQQQQQQQIQLIPTQDPGYESDSNPPSNEDTADVSTFAADEFLLSRLSSHTFNIPLTQYTVSFERLDTFCMYLSSRLYRYLPSNLKTLYEMPATLKRLAAAHFLSWTAIMAFNLFFTDFVGQRVYGGNPNAAEFSVERVLFDEGVRMGSWGLLFHCITSAIYAFFIERITAWVGVRRTYAFGMLTFTLSMSCMVFTTNVLLVNLCAAATGIGYATLTTIPFLLINKYHDSKEVSWSSVNRASTLVRLPLNYRLGRFPWTCFSPPFHGILNVNLNTLFLYLVDSNTDLVVFGSLGNFLII